MFVYLANTVCLLVLLTSLQLVDGHLDLAKYSLEIEGHPLVVQQINE